MISGNSWIYGHQMRGDCHITERIRYLNLLWESEFVLPTKITASIFELNVLWIICGIDTLKWAQIQEKRQNESIECNQCCHFAQRQTSHRRIPSPTLLLFINEVCFNTKPYGTRPPKVEQHRTQQFLNQFINHLETASNYLAKFHHSNWTSFYEDQNI